MRVHNLFLSRLVLDRVSFAVIPKHHGTERIYFSLQLSSYHSSLSGKSGKALKARTWRQEFKEKPQRNTDHWLVPYGLACFLLPSRTTFPGVVLLTVDWAFA